MLFKKGKNNKSLGLIFMVTIAVLLWLATWLFYNLQLIEINKAIEQLNQ